MADQTYPDLKANLIRLIEEQTGQKYEAFDDESPESSKEIDNLAFQIDGVGIMFTYYAAVKSDRFFVFTDFGLPPADKELAALRKLLEVNFLMYRGGAPAFTREPESGHITLMSEIPIAQTTPEQLFAYMQEIAGQCAQWRRGLFLDESSGPTVPLGAAA